MRYTARANRAPRRIESVCWWVALVFSAVFLTTIQFCITRPYGLMTLHLLAHFNADEPFQHRVLVPCLVALFTHLAPVGDRLAFALIEVGVWIAIVVLAQRALIMFGVTTNRALLRLLALSILLPLAMITLLPDLHPWPAFIDANDALNLGSWGARTLYYYPYDLPAAAFTLALLMALNRLLDGVTTSRVIGVSLLYAVATVNRETTLFVLPMAAMLFYRHPDRRRLFMVIGGLAVLFLLVECPLQWWFSGQPNPHASVPDSPYEWHITENWRYLSQPFYLATEPVRFLGGLWLPLMLWWRFVDNRLRLAVIGFVPLFVCVGLIVGRVPEHRIFTEAVPVVWIAAMQALVQRFRLL